MIETYIDNKKFPFKTIYPCLLRSIHPNDEKDFIVYALDGDDITFSGIPILPIPGIEIGGWTRDSFELFDGTIYLHNTDMTRKNK